MRHRHPTRLDPTEDPRQRGEEVIEPARPDPHRPLRTHRRVNASHSYRTRTQVTAVVRGVDIQRSDVHATLEPHAGQPERRPAIRRGLTSMTGISEEIAERILTARGTAAFYSVADVARRTRCRRG
ncbi:hypothetical protein [Streptomyces sp. 4F14]|uniref:helix-hairpin-helix domain-containing protein n=1 Tax=Streptomyces sp. 4F14 TaxID=3394380 RepID=UPI003A83DC89